MEDHHHLLQPLITTPSTTTTYSKSIISGKNDDISTTPVSSKGIIIRLVFVVLIAIISIWANYEASKGFEINVVNDTNTDSPAGRRFNLLFVSNDKITRIVLNTSEFAENILYHPTDSYKKQITRVTVKLASQNLTYPVFVKSTTKEEFELQINPSLMAERDVDKAVVLAVQRGMARIWLWNNDYGAANQGLIDGIEEYVSFRAGFSNASALKNSGNSTTVAESPESGGGCWEDKNPVAVAKFLNYCEGIRSGFIRRLNQAMKYEWSNRTVDDALGVPAQQLCESYHSLIQVS